MHEVDVPRVGHAEREGRSLDRTGRQVDADDAPPVWARNGLPHHQNRPLAITEDALGRRPLKHVLQMALAVNPEDEEICIGSLGLPQNHLMPPPVAHLDRDGLRLMVAACCNLIGDGILRGCRHSIGDLLRQILIHGVDDGERRPMLTRQAHGALQRTVGPRGEVVGEQQCLHLASPL